MPLSHTTSLANSRCMCPAENPGCRDQPFTILYRDMDVVSGRSVPADIFQMQATTRYPGAYYIFQIKSGNEGREFYMRVRGRRAAVTPFSSSALCCLAWHMLLETGQGAARRGSCEDRRGPWREEGARASRVQVLSLSVWPCGSGFSSVPCGVRPRCHLRCLSPCSSVGEAFACPFI